MAIDWEHGKRRYLYTDEDEAFARLPVLARGFAAELLKFCDRTGVITTGAEDMFDVLFRRVGAHVGERRILRDLVPKLLRDGYLVAVDGAVYIRNFVDAHYHRDPAKHRAMLDERAATLATAADRARTEREPSTSQTRVRREPSTSQTRAEHESDAKTIASIRNDSNQSEPSGPVRSGPINLSPTPPLETKEGASESGATSESTPEVHCPTVEHEINPDPAEFRFAVARAAHSSDLTAASADEDMDLKPLLRSLFAQGFGMADAPIAGAFLAAGGMGQKRAAVCDAGFLTRNRGSNLRWLLQAAREWDRAGRPRLDEKGRPVAAPAATETPPAAPVVGSELARIRAETAHAAATRETLRARLRSGT